jgi:hypothetical protein
MQLLCLLLSIAAVYPPLVESLAQPAQPAQPATPSRPSLRSLSSSHDRTRPNVSRRDSFMIGSAAATAFLAPLASNAAESTTEEASSLTVANILQGLRSIPTFCIVNAEGAAYMLYKPGEGFAKGYAFVTYEGASVVLKDAIETAEKGGYADTWKTATVTTIPADIAMRLTLQPRQRTSQKDQTASTVLFLIPGASDRDAAVQMDRKFNDQGKVPLFYFDGFKRPNGSFPMFLNPLDLVDAWKKQQDSDSTAIPPRIRVIDLVTLFQYVLRGRADELPAAIRTKQLVFVPTAEMLAKADELKAKGLVPYKLDRMVV